MNAQTIQTLKRIFQLPKSTRVLLEHPADDLHDQKVKIPSRGLRIITFDEAMSRLHISRITLGELIEAGILTRVEGFRRIGGIGVTAESYNRFIDAFELYKARLQTRVTSPALAKLRDEREAFLNTIRDLLPFTSETTAREKYEALTRLLSERKDIPTHAACLAAGVPLSAYRSYLKIHVTTPNPNGHDAKTKMIIDRITAMTADGVKELSVLGIKKALNNEGIKISRKKIAAIIDRISGSRRRLST